MNLPMRQNKKRNQALDAFASLAKTWSEWRLGERAAQSVATGTKKASKAAAKARKRARKSDSSGVKGALRSTPVRIAGAAALVGGAGAAVAKKLKGGGTAEPLYTPPPAPAPMEPPAGLEDVPAPSTGIVVGDLDASESAVASSEKAVAAATAPPPSGTEPTVPDTDPETDTGQDITAAGTDEGTVAEVGAEPDEVESAPAGDAHGDDAPTVPADSDKS